MTFLVWLVFHVAHDAAWLAIGRFTDWDIEGTLVAMVFVALTMTLVTKRLARFFPHGH